MTSRMPSHTYMVRAIQEPLSTSTVTQINAAMSPISAKLPVRGTNTN